ncbi:hypothetical protein DXG01_009165 [Tephrocybe rancida]|nr:hypothetical protein DXG01_009165 [Tephrocybe rancida]
MSRSHIYSISSRPPYLRRTQEGIASFTNLPPELVVEVLLYLDWYHLLSLRQVCKLLDTASRARALWTQHYHHYISSKRLRPRPEEPLASYTASTLEAWVVRRLSADEAWASGEGPPAGERTLPFDKEPRSLYLVKGGRWLLVTLPKSGAVQAHDLDSPGMEGMALVPPREYCDWSVKYRMVVDMDDEAPCLTFRLATYPDNSSLGCAWEIMIWGITLSGHGAGARLEAQLLCSLHVEEPTFGGNRPSAFSLRENLVAVSIDHPGVVDPVQIFDWTCSTSSSHRKGERDPRRLIQDCHLLLGNRLAVLDGEAISLYAIDPLVDTKPFAPMDSAREPSPPLWVLPCGYTYGIRFRQSRWISDDDATYGLELNFQSVVQALVVPHTHDEPPSLLGFTGLTRQKNWGVPLYLGMEKALWGIKGPRNVRPFFYDFVGVSYTWESGAMRTTRQGDLVVSLDMEKWLGRRRKKLPVKMCTMDEETGRVVFVVEWDAVAPLCR